MGRVSGLFKILAVAGFFALASPPEADADYYSYVDSKGVIHITNAPTSSRYKWRMPESGRSSASGAGKRQAVSRSSYDTLIDNISSAHGVETALVKAMIKVESDFDTYAISEDGAAGLMQLMPDTAAKMGVIDIHDPGQNVRGGVKFFKKLLGTFKSDLRLALAAYNAGENAVLKYGKVPPYPETRNYVEKVLRYRDKYKKASG